MKFGLKTSVLLTAGILGSIATAHADVDVYGKIHVSGDYIDNGASTDKTMGSNSSRIGFKGKEDLQNGLTALWKIENELDVTGEYGNLKARNRYVGLQHKFGTVLAGYHDTPYKTFGGKVGVMHDTIAERRGILGAAAGAGNKMNIRAKNSAMYISPNLMGVEVSAMQSTGEDDKTGLDENPVTSASAVYTNDMLYVGAAYEEQTGLDATGIRAGAGIKFANAKVNLIYETTSSDSADEWNRDAFGGSVTYTIGDTTLEAQAFKAGDYRDMDKSGGLLYGIGVEHKLGKNMNIYALYASVNNDDNAKFVLAGSGHGEKYTPAAKGDDLTGFSAGVSYSF